MEQIVDFPEQTVEQIVYISPGDGLGLGSTSSAGAADEEFTGFFALSLWKKFGVPGRWLSAQLGERVSSSTLSAHQMARAGEPVDSGGSIEWVKLHNGDLTSPASGTDAPVRPLGTLLWVFRSSGSGR